MKNLSLLLVLLLLLQSCSVYHSPTTVEKAVAADNKVKVISADQQKYKFKRLEEENGRLTGVTKPRSSTAEKLAGMPAETEGRFLKVDLSEVTIEEIRLRNNTLSTIINIAIPVVAVLTGLIALVAATMPLSY